MASIVFFPNVCGARYYLHRRIVNGREIFDLIHERDGASEFEDGKARELASYLRGSVRPSDWQEDEKKYCTMCGQVKSIDDFYLTGMQKYPHLRRSMCKNCDNGRRRLR